MSDKFGETLRRLRLYHNLTQEQLAKKLDLTKTTISCYESGKRTPNHETEEAIADYFNISLDSLRGYEPVDYNIQDVAPEIQTTIYFMKEMDEATRKHLLAYAEYLWKTNKKDGDE